MNNTTPTNPTAITFDQLKSLQETYRKKHRRTALIAYLSAIALTALTTLIVLATQPVENLYISVCALVFFLVLAAIIVAVATHKPLTAFKEAYKTYFVRGGLEKVFTNVAYDHDRGLEPAIVATVMRTADRYNSNDLIIATYKDVNFAQADVHTEERHTTTDANGHTTVTYSDLFKGRFLIFDFNRNFTFALQVNTKWFQGALRPKTTSDLSFRKIKTESAEFNKRFEIYGQDGVDTFYVLDPAFIEKIQTLQQTCNCQLSLTFLDKKLYIALNNKKDSFELTKPRKPLDEQTELEKVNKDISVITQFVDALSLDKYLFKPKDSTK